LSKTERRTTSPVRDDVSNVFFETRHHLVISDNNRYQLEHVFFTGAGQCGNTLIDGKQVYIYNITMKHLFTSRFHCSYPNYSDHFPGWVQFGKGLLMGFAKISMVKHQGLPSLPSQDPVPRQSHGLQS